MSYFVSDEVAYNGIQAVDNDGDLLVYTIESDYFSIHPTSGLVIIARTLSDSSSGTSLADVLLSLQTYYSLSRRIALVADVLLSLQTYYSRCRRITLVANVLLSLQTYYTRCRRITLFSRCITLVADDYSPCTSLLLFADVLILFVEGFTLISVLFSWRIYHSSNAYILHIALL